MEMRVYISGPITNTPDHRERFAGAVRYFQGLNPELTPVEALINPLEVTAECRVDPGAVGCGWAEKGSDPNDGGNGHTWECWMKYDLLAMDGLDTIALIPGWHRSRGSKMELHKALTNNWQVLVLKPRLFVLNAEPGKFYYMV
jgi:hypothetical protein